MPQRYGASAEKERRAKEMLRQKTMSFPQIAAAVGTSKSQIQRFASEIKDDDELLRTADELPYNGEGTESRWTPSAALELERKARRQAEADAEKAEKGVLIVCDENRKLRAENKQLRAQLGEAA